LRLEGGQFTSLESNDGDKDNVAGAEMVFGPDIDFVSANTLIQPEYADGTREGWLTAEKLALMCMIDMKHRLAGLEPTLEYLEVFRSWLISHLERTKISENIFVEVVVEGERLDSFERRALIASLYEQAMKEKASGVATLVKRVLDNCENLFQGAIQPLEILLPENGLTKLYNLMEQRINWGGFFTCLGHSNPGLRILEIGAGTGGFTHCALMSLMASNGVRLYSRYT